jgi:hypothetical protein
MEAISSLGYEFARLLMQRNTYSLLYYSFFCEEFGRYTFGAASWHSLLFAFFG